MSSHFQQLWFLSLPFTYRCQWQNVVIIRNSFCYFSIFIFRSLTHEIGLSALNKHLLLNNLTGLLPHGVHTRFKSVRETFCKRYLQDLHIETYIIYANRNKVLARGAPSCAQAQSRML